MKLSTVGGHTKGDGWPQGRFIYIEVVAGIALLLGFLWIIPHQGGFVHCEQSADTELEP
jgi:hypothetical protein